MRKLILLMGFSLFISNTSFGSGGNRQGEKSDRVQEYAQKGKQTKRHKPYFFIQISDPQFGFMDSNKSLTAETLLMEQTVVIINRLKPDFVVITGDLVNSSHDIEQISEYKRTTANIDPTIPVYIIPGNHDISNTADSAQVALYRSNYGSDKFSFIHKSAAFIGLNSCVIKQNNTESEAAQFAWLESELARASAANVKYKFIFSHHSFFLKSLQEADNYSNIQQPARQKYIDLFHKYGVNALFSGHLHDHSFGQDAELEVVTIGAVGRALGKGFHGMNIVKVYPDRYTHEYIALDRVPTSIVF